jgi:hypothetical protein
MNSRATNLVQTPGNGANTRITRAGGRVLFGVIFFAERGIMPAVEQEIAG